MTPEEMAWAQRLERLRHNRRPPPTEPTPRELRQFGASSTELKRRVKFRNDPSLKLVMEQGEADLRKRRKDLAAAASAWRDTVEMHLKFSAALVTLQRGVLTVVVENHGQRYELDRVLRAGTRSHFEKNCRARIAQIRVVVGKVPETMAGVERRTRTRDEVETELQEHLDAGLITEADAGRVLDTWAEAEREAQTRDSESGGGGKDPASVKRP